MKEQLLIDFGDFHYILIDLIIVYLDDSSVPIHQSILVEEPNFVKSLRHNPRETIWLIIRKLPFNNLTFVRTKGSGSTLAISGIPSIHRMLRLIV